MLNTNFQLFGISELFNKLDISNKDLLIIAICCFIAILIYRAISKAARRIRYKVRRFARIPKRAFVSFVRALILGG